MKIVSRYWRCPRCGVNSKTEPTIIAVMADISSRFKCPRCNDDFPFENNMTEESGEEHEFKEPKLK